eukprot:2023289-Alexandrium_andersonii.AAC.1
MRDYRWPMFANTLARFFPGLARSAGVWPRSRQAWSRGTEPSVARLARRPFLGASARQCQQIPCAGYART